MRDLSGISILRDLARGPLERTAAACRWQSFQKGEAIVNHLDGDRDVLFLVAGSARVCVYSAAGQPLSFRDIRAGEAFGELAAIDGGARSAFVEALTPCIAARLPAARFIDLVRSEPAVALAVLGRVAALVRDLSERLQAATAQKADQRIRADILRRAAETGHRGNTVTLSPAPVHSEIAARVGTQREAVSREMSRLAKVGLVRRQDGDLVLPDLDALRSLWTAHLGS